MNKHDVLISARNVETFRKVDSILPLFKESFLKKFNTCDASTFGHGILKMVSKFYYNEKGVIIPSDGVLERIFIEPENRKSCEVTVRFKDLLISFEYISTLPIDRFETESVVNVEELMVVMKSNDES